MLERFIYGRDPALDNLFRLAIIKPIFFYSTPQMKLDSTGGVLASYGLKMVTIGEGYFYI